MAGVIGWRWWARARGVHLVLLGGTVLSLAASLLMTNNFGGGAWASVTPRISRPRC